MSKASNILRQINSKVGGDLYQLKFPEAVTKKRVMLIGIDVCHSGPNSVVGFVASTNPGLSQYYSEHIVQKKNQEIVSTHMTEAIMRAVHAFAEKHNRNFPTHFIIYRDGVGETMRDQVIRSEVEQFKQAITQCYNNAEHEPKIALVVVNKRITQRFFVKDAQGRLSNPPSGCIIDRTLVENEISDKTANRPFDFYLTPATANQGCVLPTHIFVAMNETGLTKVEL